MGCYLAGVQARWRRVAILAFFKTQFVDHNGAAWSELSNLVGDHGLFRLAGRFGSSLKLMDFRSTMTATGKFFLTFRSTHATVLLVYGGCLAMFLLWR